ncbi:hypothetical protein [Streptomyces endophyticus]|uniref:Secreted protein n=1 Tax=Streptomyces endophyticus TaxID=714166 RepID=A0ABU6FDS4_9ACTN|nr:hypothetical protein [Streptomyces endophyticus]MEB8342119.1 hypothetical protein [Streptomyces endophyticus]
MSRPERSGWKATIPGFFIITVTLAAAVLALVLAPGEPAVAAAAGAIATSGITAGAGILNRR